MEYEVNSFTRVGGRETNQDRLLSNLRLNDALYCAVADGMGGEEGGEIAAELAVATLRDVLTLDAKPTLSRAYAGVASALAAKTRDHPNLFHMGTTLTTVRLYDGKGLVAHVGDTRLYQLRGQGIQALTPDQTEVQELVEKGVITRSQARNYHRKNVLLSVISPASTYDFFQTEFLYEGGDRLLLTTDGLHGVLGRREIRDLSVSISSNAVFCRALSDLACERKPSDNYSAICIEVIA